MKRTTLVLLAVVSAMLPCAFVACGGGSDNLPPPPPPPTAPPPPPVAASTAPAPPPVEDAGPPAPAAPPVTLTLGASSPDPQPPLPTVKITQPAKGQLVPAAKAGDFEVKLDVKNWKTATGSQHVHLILDGKPYKAIYDTKAPVKLSELADGEALAEGQHVLVSFPSRANHESVKTKDAITVVEFFVGPKKGDIKQDLAKPMLVYSRPKGAYKGEMANHVLIDFQLWNTTLGDGKEKVSIHVTGPGIEGDKSATADKFGPPWYLDNLQNGDYTIKLELLGADGKTAPGPWNSTSRTIKVDRDAPADPMPHPMPDGGATTHDGGSH